MTSKELEVTWLQRQLQVGDRLELRRQHEGGARPLRAQFVRLDREGGWVVGAATGLEPCTRWPPNTLIELQGRLVPGPFLVEARLVRTGRERRAQRLLVVPRTARWLERRTLKRVAVALPLTFQPGRAAGWSSPHRGTTVDLSASGARARVAGAAGQPLQAGTSGTVEIELQPGTPAFGCRARVVSTKGREFAVAFQDLEPRDEDRLVAFVFQEELKNRRRR